ncbi:hypothetical protein D3C85_1637910 [compost metagenome]
MSPSPVIFCDTFIMASGERQIGLADSRWTEHRHGRRLLEEKFLNQGANLHITTKAARFRRHRGYAGCNRFETPQIGGEVLVLITI